ncbi:MAG TPA: glycoside hydrolase family 76 protein [Chloroflexia bacterium]|nr:glycoside hydrolase family 76 protein [Chloroflexia bacterium]
MRANRKRTKSVLSLTLAVFLAGWLAACSDQAPTSLPAKTLTRTPDNLTQKGTKNLGNQQKAEQTYQAINKIFYRDNLKLYVERTEPKEGDKDYSTLWPFSGMLSALNAMATMPDNGANYKTELRRVLNELEQYWDSHGAPPAYDSYVVKFGGGPKFYDDNEWLGLDFVEAYHTLGDSQYLKKAEAMFDFAISGWSDDFGGGIYWRENDPSTKNTCSNGPAAVLALKLYQETHEARYLDWAKKILNWTRQLKAPSGVYWDHVMLGGELDKRTFTYNTGTILHSNALLYQITGDKTYLSEAQALAQASLAYFTTQDTRSGLAFYPDTPWFNAVLLKGYLALYQADPAHDPRYIQSMKSNLDWAWEHARDGRGLFSPDWTGQSGVTNPSKWILDQAAMVELYALFTRF